MSASKKRPAPIFTCEKCSSYILPKDVDLHSNENCPPTVKKILYPFISKNIMYGILETKISETNNLPNNKDNLVFLSHFAMQLCDFALGDKVFVKNLENNLMFERTVWHSNEKSIMSIQFTKRGVETSFMKNNVEVSISKSTNTFKKAKSVTLVCLNADGIELDSNLVKIIHRNYKSSFLKENLKIGVLFYGKSLKFEVRHIEKLYAVENIENSFEELNIVDVELYQVIDKTKWKVFNKDDCIDGSKKKLITTIGGLDKIISEVKRLMNKALGKVTGISNSDVTRGVLLYGLPGTGKTLLAKALAEESEANIINVSYTEECRHIEKETQYRLSEEAIKSSPTIILIDNCEEFCSVITSRSSVLEKKINERFTNLFEDLEKNINSHVFILATSNKLDLIDSKFQQFNRLKPIEIAIPNKAGRLDILKKLLDGKPNKVTNEQLEHITMFTNGFVGTDLLSLYMAALHNAEELDYKEVNWSNFKTASAIVKPSLVRRLQIEVPNVKWSDIGGQRKLKQILQQSVERSLKDPEALKRLGRSSARGVLMYGPPGCSKTMIAKAMATESGLIFLSIGPEVFDKYVGESERNVREVFSVARQVAPSVIFFDEIDAIGCKRNSGAIASVQDRVLTQLLIELDGLKALGDIVALAATNRPDRIDKALLRRFGKIIHVPLPDAETRKEIFELKISKLPVFEVDLNCLVQHTENYSGAEIQEVCNTAVDNAYEEDAKLEKIEIRHFLKALEEITPKTPSSLVKLNENYSSN